MKIAFVLYDRALQSGITLASDMLNSASSLRSRKQQREDPLHMSVVGDWENNHEKIPQITLNTHHQFSDQVDFDLVFLPPMWGNPLSSMAGRDDILEWLNRQKEKQALIVATGTGVCWLAKAGLLEEQTVTTHWYFYDKFEHHFPTLDVNRKASITYCDNIYCVRSINSQTELLVYLIAQFFSIPIAEIIEKHFLHEVSNFQSEPFFQIGGNTQFDEMVSIAQDYIKQHIDSQITIKDIAAYAGVSESTLLRRFKGQVGISPHKYILNHRLLTAKKLLTDNGLTLLHVAQLVGFRDAYYFSQVFEQHFKLTPTAYRKLVRAKVFQA
ncbi:transcriptional regulator ExsA [Xenorhabdus vietnamensis]|uniref:Transcriptional regulator ExsA n=1 Tax=Xenorhabdus vietnamensis TaxID=351656 RepID=A0A1Y2SA47_9GAMM|nr:helix-turn-helix domain-containing protein [Xenorhabdus vietnamensis]OTA15057.1 transcriptional regulator ExsA [Xenorhabdus vietnamensis]OTA16588.1 transcriptional regulator ExsA [Xenorhabdus vietnamensis]